MTGLCGWFGAEREGEGPSIEDRGSTLPGHLDLSAAQSPQGACLVRGGWTTREPDGLVVAIAGHPRWRRADLAALSEAHGPALALVAAYRRHSEQLLQHLAGGFVLAVLDPIERRLLIAIDRMGQFPMHYARRGGTLVFGTTADSVLAHPGMERRIRPDGLYRYLYFHMVPSPASPFEGLAKLPAGHRIWLADDDLQVRRYWWPRFQQSRDTDQQALEQTLTEHLERAVERLLHNGPTGAFLSGGIDSSTVAGMLARLRPGRVDTFSIGFDAVGYDEMAYARIAANHFGCRAHEYYVTPQDVAEALPRIAASYDEPFGNSSALPAWFCARMAAEAGMHRLLAGDGGDELFAGNQRYAAQRIFEYWNRIPARLRQGVLEPLFSHLPERPALLRKARRYVEQARIPLPERLQSYNFLHRIDPGEIFQPDFLAQVNQEAPLEAMRAIYRLPEGATSLNRMLFLDWQHTLADNDLRKVGRMCQLAGVDVAYPMLDDDLVEFSLGVPSDLQLKHGRLRHFYKEALKDFLPPAIIGKKKHGFGLPFGIWMRDYAPLAELAGDSLLRLKRRQDFIKPSFIDRLIRLHGSGHAAYYGELVWVLMMLDLWLETHEPSSSTSDAGQSAAASYPRG